jgi:hypothetical protein
MRMVHLLEFGAGEHWHWLSRIEGIAVSPPEPDHLSLVCGIPYHVG